jgi:hypothetical protein
LSNKKYEAIRWALLAIYYWIILSRTFNFFIVHIKGEAFAEKFREKRKPLGSKVIW